MSINSIRFLLTICFILCLFFLFQKSKIQKYIVLLASMYFVFAFSGKKGLLITCLIVAAVYISGRRIEKSIQDKNRNIALLWLWIGGIIDIGVLLYFKYFISTWAILEKK